MYWNTSIIICVYTIHRDISFILKKIGTRYYRYTYVRVYGIRIWKAISESNAVEKRIRRVCARASTVRVSTIREGRRSIFVTMIPHEIAGKEGATRH